MPQDPSTYCMNVGMCPSNLQFHVSSVTYKQKLCYTLQVNTFMHTGQSISVLQLLLNKHHSRRVISVLFQYSMEIAAMHAVSQMSNFCLSLPNYNLSLPIWAMIHPYFRHWVQLLQCAFDYTYLGQYISTA